MRLRVAAVAGMALLTGPVAAQPTPPSPPVVAPAAAAAPAPPPGCEGVAAERAALEAEKAEIGGTITDVAMGRTRQKRKKMSGGDVARGVGGGIASILLPFPLGMALNAGASAAKGKKKGAVAAPAGPNVAGLIEREREIGLRLGELARCGG